MKLFTSSMSWFVLIFVCFCGYVEGMPQEIEAKPIRVDPGGQITVNYSGAPGYDRDWIGIYPASAPPDRSWLSWQYTQKKKSGTMIFKAPDKPGEYNFRLFENDGYKLLGTSNTVVVENLTVKEDIPKNTIGRDLAGTWNWVSGQTLIIRTDGTFDVYSGNSKINEGQWTILDTARRQVRFTHRSGGWIDTVILSSDGNTLDGTNNTGSALRGTKRAGAPPLPPMPNAIRYRVENLAYNAPDKYLNPRNYHDFLVDFTTCSVRELNQATQEGKETIEVSVCRDKNHLTIKTVNTDSGYYVLYDWVFLENGRIIAGAWHDPGGWGSSVGQIIQE